MARSFAWGIAPSSSRPAIKYAYEQCNISDEEWSDRLLHEHTSSQHHALSRCTIPIRSMKIPKLLLNELILRLAKRVLQCDQVELIMKTPPLCTIHEVLTTDETPPMFYAIKFTACFPCPGQSITRCALVTAILDATSIVSSVVIEAIDAGVVPQDQSVTMGVMPSNSHESKVVVAA